MRLIDADNLIKDLGYLYTKNHVPVDMRAKQTLSTIMEQPIVYDMNKVIGDLYALKRYKNKYDSYYENSMYQLTELENDYINSTIDKVIQIVKAGGTVNE